MRLPEVGGVGEKYAPVGREVRMKRHSKESCLAARGEATAEVNAEVNNRVGGRRRGVVHKTQYLAALLHHIPARAVTGRLQRQDRRREQREIGKHALHASGIRTGRPGAREAARIAGPRVESPNPRHGGRRDVGYRRICRDVGRRRVVVCTNGVGVCRAGSQSRIAVVGCRRGRDLHAAAKNAIARETRTAAVCRRRPCQIHLCRADGRCHQVLRDRRGPRCQAQPASSHWQEEKNPPRHWRAWRCRRLARCRNMSCWRLVPYCCSWSLSWSQSGRHRERPGSPGDPNRRCPSTPTMSDSLASN